MTRCRKSIVALLLGLSPMLVAACSDSGESAPTNPNADASTGEADAQTHGYVRDPAPQVGDISLPDLSADGEPFQLQAKPDGLLVVFFGFTNCPDVCPTTMSDLSHALNRLDPADAERVEVAMITVDPERDMNTLTEYVQSFVPGSHGLGTTKPAELRSAAEAFGASYVVDKAANGEVEVGHSDHLYGVDDTGSMVITWPFPTGAEGIAADLEKLLHGDV